MFGGGTRPEDNGKPPSTQPRTASEKIPICLFMLDHQTQRQELDSPYFLHVMCILGAQAGHRLEKQTRMRHLPTLYKAPVTYVKPQVNHPAGKMPGNPNQALKFIEPVVVPEDPMEFRIMYDNSETRLF